MPKEKPVGKKGRETKAIAVPAPLKDEIALIEKRLDELSFRPVLLVAQSKESSKIVDQISNDLKKAVKTPILQEMVVDNILGDIVAGAYIDRITVYSAQLKENAGDYMENLQKLLSMRQTADMHLLKIVKAIKDIKQPKASLTVKEAQQVNVADKQVNISQNRSDENVQNP
jgi:hypothetical protein